MTPDLVVAPQASSIYAMMTSYLHELTPGGPTVYPWLSLYWEDPRRTPYLIRVGSLDVGFALVRAHVGTALHEVVEFYVTHAHRRKGIGRRAARALFDRHPGWWHLQILEDNTIARTFWRSVVPESAEETHRVAGNGCRFVMMQFRCGAVPAHDRRP